jgi:hypothetical protein
MTELSLTEYINEQNLKAQHDLEKDIAYKMASVVAIYIISHYVDDKFYSLAHNGWPHRFEEVYNRMYGESA